MIKKILIVTVAIAIAIPGVYIILKTKRTSAKDELQTASPQQIIAKFDTTSNCISLDNDSVVYVTINWLNNSEKSLREPELKLLLDKKEPLFINLFIWSKEVISKLDNDVAVNILKGEYDKKLVSFFSLLSKKNKQVYVRFNPEMEVPLYKYPWQAGSFNEYIASFRHIYSICKKYAPSVQIVWGPSGYPGAEEYWPGDDFVDLISLNLNMDKEFANDPYPLYPSVAEMIRRKFFRMRFMKKPILFLGSTSVNRSNLNQQWLTGMNSKILADKNIYRTSTIATEHDTINVIKERSKPLQLGVYDPLLLLTGQPLITTEHLFTDIISVLNGYFKKNFDSVVSRHHNVIVTMEPWKDGKKVKDPAILTNTVNGTYDKVWTKLYEILSNTTQTVYLRWGHEMEIPIDRYAWQSMDPVAYIKAFRYFATFQKPRANNIKLVWGPAGDRGSVEWWPGEDVVDFVSFAIYGLPDKNINDYNRQQSFSDIFQYKFHRMRFTHRPIFITEFGVKGPEAYQKKWLLEATATINNYPEIYGLSYFNFADTPKAWGDAETPDWSITDSTFKGFTNLLK
jgi:beta-mannanase